MSGKEIVDEAVILAGGLGTRLSEETGLRPKPMVEICGIPIILHIMQYLNKSGIDKFVICCGYKSNIIKDYFTSMIYHKDDIEIDFQKEEIRSLTQKANKWRVRLIETGERNMTGSRLMQALKYVDGNEFLFTYGDGLTNQDIQEQYKYHKQSNRIATVTAVQPPGRFGSLQIEGNCNAEICGNVNAFEEKPKGETGWINGGYFILDKRVEKYLNKSNDLVFEGEPLMKLAKDGELNAYKHSGFWKPMDTLKDKRMLEEMYNAGEAPWAK